MLATLITRNETDSDKEWTSYAVKNRHNITIYSYNNLGNHIFMKTLKGASTTIQIALHDQGYKNSLMKTCNSIGVDYPNDTDLSFKRDYYLIRDAESIYFNGYFDISTKARLQIKGREAWLVEMFVHKIQEIHKLEEQKTINEKQKKKIHNGLIPVYMFSENLLMWCQLNYKSRQWIRIIKPPSPVGKYLAFGTDPISTTAKIELGIL